MSTKWIKLIIAILCLFVMGKVVMSYIASAGVQHKVTALEMYTLYYADEAKARDMYLNKIIEVSGTIEDIGDNSANEAYIALGTEGKFKLEIISEKIKSGNVLCKLRGAERQKAAKLHMGQRVVIRKNSTGYENPLINNCIIVSS